MLKNGLLRQGGYARLWSNEDLIRSEQFGPERLEQHAISLAALQACGGPRMGGHALARRLRQNESALLQAYRAIARAVEDGHTITPSAEWILDNYHIVEEQIFQIKGDLPPGYYRQLPRIAQGPLRRLATRLRNRLGICRPHGQPVRRRHAVPDARRVSAGPSPDDRRTLGRRRSRFASSWSRTFVAPPSGSCKSHRLRRRADAIADRVLGLSCRRADPDFRGDAETRPDIPPDPPGPARASAPRPGPLVTSSIHWLDEQAVRQGRHDGRFRRPRAPAPGRDERHRPQHHHQHAADLRHRLGRDLRARQPGR